MRVTKSALLASLLAFAPAVFADGEATLDKVDNGFILNGTSLSCQNSLCHLDDPCIFFHIMNAHE